MRNKSSFFLSNNLFARYYSNKMQQAFITEVLFLFLHLSNSKFAQGSILHGVSNNINGKEFILLHETGQKCGMTYLQYLVPLSRLNISYEFVSPSIYIYK